MEGLRTISFVEAMKGRVLKAGMENSKFVRVTDDDMVDLVDLMVSVSGCTRSAAPLEIRKVSDIEFPDDKIVYRKPRRLIGHPLMLVSFEDAIIFVQAVDGTEAKKNSAQFADILRQRNIVTHKSLSIHFYGIFKGRKIRNPVIRVNFEAQIDAVDIVKAMTGKKAIESAEIRRDISPSVFDPARYILCGKRYLLTLQNAIEFITVFPHDIPNETRLEFINVIRRYRGEKVVVDTALADQTLAPAEHLHLEGAPVLDQPWVPPAVLDQPLVPPAVLDQPLVPPAVLDQPLVPPAVLDQPLVPPAVLDQPLVPPAVLDQPLIPPAVLDQPLIPSAVLDQYLVPMIDKVDIGLKRRREELELDTMEMVIKSKEHERVKSIAADYHQICNDDTTMDPRARLLLKDIYFNMLMNTKVQQVQQVQQFMTSEPLDPNVSVSFSSVAASIGYKLDPTESNLVGAELKKRYVKFNNKEPSKRDQVCDGMITSVNNYTQKDTQLVIDTIRSIKTGINVYTDGMGE